MILLLINVVNPVSELCIFLFNCIYLLFLFVVNEQILCLHICLRTLITVILCSTVFLFFLNIWNAIVEPNICSCVKCWNHCLALNVFFLSVPTIVSHLKAWDFVEKSKFDEKKSVNLLYSVALHCWLRTLRLPTIGQI